MKTRDKAAALFLRQLGLAILCGLASAACPAGYSSRTNVCYKIYHVTADTTQTDAQRQCQADDPMSYLVSIRNIEDNDFYVSKFPANTQVWIGLTRERPSHPVWRYVSDGQPVLNQGCYRYDANNTDFREMAPQSPPGGVTYKTCVDYCKSKASSNYAYAAVTGTSGNFKCGCAAANFAKDQQFDPGSNPKDPGCTQLCDGDTNRCGNDGYMVVLKIGGSGFDQWAYGQTNNFDGYQTCGALITQHNPDKLGDEMYSTRFPYICHDKFHNFHVIEDYVSWFEARNRCRKTYSGGDLAKLRNNTDRDNLSPLGAKAYWTGLINTVWKWPNGDDVVWSAWESGQPNWKPNSCVTLNTGAKSWSDAECTKGLRDFACEVYARSSNNSPGNGGTTEAANGGNLGASTGNNNSLDTLEIVLIVVCVLFLILIIILIVLVFYFKKKNNRKNKIGYDIRSQAPVPSNTQLGEEVYLPAEELDRTSSTGSETNLIKEHRLQMNRKPLPHININGDIRH